MQKKYWFVVLMAFLWSSCQFYTFRGISISDEVKSFSVAQFKIIPPIAPPTLGQTVGEKLKNRIRNNTRLKRVDADTEADLAFVGTIVGYDIVSVASQPGQAATLNQLKISVEMEVTNAKEEKKTYRQIFSFQQDFPATTDILAVQDQLINTISEKLIDDIFNKTFTEDW